MRSEPGGGALRGALLCATLLCAAACTAKRAPMTVSDLMDDRLTLDRVLTKCNLDVTKARDDSSCLNARIAVERLAKDADPAEIAKHNAAFEHNRERLRLAQEAARREQEARNTVDPYSMPVLRLDAPPAASPAPTASAAIAAPPASTVPMELTAPAATAAPPAPTAAPLQPP